LTKAGSRIENFSRFEPARTQLRKLTRHVSRSEKQSIHSGKEHFPREYTFAERRLDLIFYGVVLHGVYLARLSVDYHIGEAFRRPPRAARQAALSRSPLLL
jgi:hypothetical protein